MIYYKFSERESPLFQVWDESEVGYGVPLKTERFVMLQVSENTTLFLCVLWFIKKISVTIPTSEKTGTKIMGVDLGLKVPVAVTEDGSTRFFGNGRQNEYVRRMFKFKR